MGCRTWYLHVGYCLFHWQLPDGHCSKCCPTWIFKETSTRHCGQKANIMSFYRCSIIKNNILCRSLYNNQNTKVQAHSIWEKHKNRVHFVKCQRWFLLDRGGYIKSVCFAGRCHFWCSLTRLSLVPGFQGRVFCLISLHLHQQMSVYLRSWKWG